MTPTTKLSEAARRALSTLAETGDWHSASTVHWETRHNLAEAGLVSVASKRGDERVRISARGRKALQA